MVKVKKDECISCGLCVDICGEVFEMGSDGKAQVKKGANTDAPCTKKAIAACPVGAIVA